MSYFFTLQNLTKNVEGYSKVVAKLDTTQKFNF